LAEPQGLGRKPKRIILKIKRGRVSSKKEKQKAITVSKGKKKSMNLPNN
jgi:hypothetical protein